MKNILIKYLTSFVLYDWKYLQKNYKINTTNKLIKKSFFVLSLYTRLFSKKERIPTQNEQSGAFYYLDFFIVLLQQNHF